MYVKIKNLMKGKLQLTDIFQGHFACSVGWHEMVAVCCMSGQLRVDIAGSLIKLVVFE